MFALHQVVYPGHRTALHVFEGRYRRMMADVLPNGTFCIVAIKSGREVAGEYEPYGVGVEVSVDDAELVDDGTYAIVARGRRRVRLIEPLGSDPYPTWEVEPYPDAEELVEEERVLAAAGAAARFLEVAGGPDLAKQLTVDPDDPTGASYSLAMLAPVLVPERQEFLEVPGTGERLRRVAKTLRMEAGLLEALHARGSG